MLFDIRLYIGVVVFIGSIKGMGIIIIFKTVDIKSNNLIEGKNILLIDDILTSKATTDICSTLLCNNGANKVSILCAAETFLDPNWKQKRS